MPIKSRNLIDEDDPRVSKIGHPAPPWLINYADLMTELVCFFVILYALSAALNPSLQRAKSTAEEMIKKTGLKGSKVAVTKEGLNISIQEKEEKAFFASGSAELTTEGVGIVDKMAAILLSMPNEVVIEGHTDNVPIGASHTKYASNWELSTARATTVVRYLVQKYNFPPERLAAIGYGEFKPIAPNDTDENKRKNRRVVFFVKNTVPKSVEKAGAQGTETKEEIKEGAIAPTSEAQAPTSSIETPTEEKKETK